MYRETEFSDSKKRISRLAVACLMFLALVYQTSKAQAGSPMTTFQGSADGIFTNPSGGTFSGVGTNYFTWGEAFPTVSSLKYTGYNFSVTTPTGYILGSAAQRKRPFFSIGTLNYQNGTIVGGSGAGSVRLDVSAKLTFPVAAGPTVVPSQLDLVNTPNTDDPVASADFVYLPTSFPPVTLTTVNGLPITVEPSGFGNVSAGGFTQIDKFFVYENGSASADLFAKIVSPAESIVRNAVKETYQGAKMRASFTPNFNLSITDAAKLCGYDHFNWYQVITEWSDPNLFAKTDPTTPLTAPPSFVDPPIGGYTYQENGDDSLPFYLGENGPTAFELQAATTNTTLSFLDIPANPLLQTGDKMAFITFLVGVLPDGTWETLYSWSWQSTFNGKVGGVAVTKNTVPVDPGSGTGGVTILAEDLTAEEIPQSVRELMQRDGVRNIIVTILSAFRSLSNGWYRSIPKISLTTSKDTITYYKWDSGSWKTYTGSFNAIRGIHTLYYFSKNIYGSSELIKRRQFKVDSYKPRTYAPYKKTIRRTQSARLYWKASDPYTVSKGDITLKLQKKYGSAYKTIKNIKYGLTTINKLRYSSQKFNSKGTYRFMVYAKDQAGNNQYNIARNYVIVN